MDLVDPVILRSFIWHGFSRKCVELSSFGSTIMNRGLISVVSVFAENRLDGNSGENTRDAAALYETNHRHLPAVGSSNDERMRCPRWASDTSVLTESEGTPKAVKFSHRSLWCCFFLLMPVVIPVLIYIKDSDVTRRIFLGLFIVILIILLVCFSLVIFETRTRQMLAMRSISDEDDQVDLHNFRSTLPPANQNLLAATHRILTSNPLRSACRATRTNRASPTTRQMVRFQSPVHSLSIASPTRLPHTSPLRTAASAPTTPCSSSPIVRIATNDSLQLMQPHFTAPRENLRLPLTRPQDNPPPYHVAINLPAPEAVDGLTVETPPPPYENAMN